MKWTRHGFPWVVASAPVAAAILLLGLTLDLPVMDEGGASLKLPQLQVTMAGATGGVALRERMQLLDPTPLFLPSPLSSTRLHYPSTDVDAGGVVLADYEPRLVASGWFTPEGGGLGASKPAMSVGNAIGAPESRLPFLGLARQDVTTPELPARWAVVSIYSTKTQQFISRMPLPAPEQGVLPQSMWSPMELFLITEADGAVGGPMLISSTGISEVDDYIVDTVKKIYAMGAGLKPGSYRLSVGQ